MAGIKGTIVRLVIDKGFGFARRTNGDVDYFFHRTDLENAAFGNLHVGQAVTFEEASNGMRGPRARSVQVVDVSADGDGA
jgi:CspA family cold shock protein